MLIVKVQDGENIERALKRFKRKYRDTKVLQKVRENQQFTKKSVERRKEVGKAAYIQNLRDEADQ
ncbi:MAG: 30S ribosomal protein S21 [Flavobacteriaceae bacterium CG_4_8_14_3_um_filter_34_10]|nr:30S ribosomal protein S21 [Flavobacteriia bacterium]OIP51913.1 MAG: 30S ribosomal protein S21 [Flavobacteriaceae bacterium CG2_30_34_30]PIQ18607.1 MAG: 30S ribosomal protein S21 [Flavobacteriaceae bacterium CG18_big_fil_WC_8_21_14_2_50_34_36]PIV48668.1 MAG: 30S ribosomal protein S21 [Flavobacteriaceae bacterium CG02_land_8_20_14_3_00_34_13]PIX08424.1 MAG: 30S ribosomal protein S21 [Flavobacteriaceae bacterium CG_4_8_14_3_um_filter_34_10]PIZ07709.1 MAG: 30S ribosomal protein S21 [Flavobacter